MLGFRTVCSFDLPWFDFPVDGSHYHTARHLLGPWVVGVNDCNLVTLPSVGATY